MTPAEELRLAELLTKKQALERIMTSGVLEVEQPQLGRTQYRSLEEVERALRYINSGIGDLIGTVDPTTAWKRTRRPIYPVVTE